MLHLSLESAERCFDYALLKERSFGITEFGVAANMLYPGASDDPRCAYRDSYAIESRDQRYRNASSFDLFYYRCTATIAGPSGGYEQTSINSSINHLLGHLGSEPFRNTH